MCRILDANTAKEPGFLNSLFATLRFDPKLKCVQGHEFPASKMLVDQSFANNLLLCPHCQEVVTTVE